MSVMSASASERRMEVKAECLAEALHINVSEIQYDEKGDNKDVQFKTPKGTFVVMDEPESLASIKDVIEATISKSGLSEFSDIFKKSILDSCVVQQEFKRILQEETETVAENLDAEPGEIGKTRLIDECLNAGIISVKELSEDGNCSREDLSEIYAEFIVDTEAQAYNEDYFKTYKADHTEEALNEIFKTNYQALNRDEAVAVYARLIDFGDVLSEDGKTLELDCELFAYKIEEPEVEHKKARNDTAREEISM